MKVYTGSNPTELYLQMLKDLCENGTECSPRGKLIKELRPVCVEFTQPTNRMTFANNRRINPFFQLAESLWIVSGRADVAFLSAFNANMKSFSDDGVYFNASYGERIRFFSKNSLHNFIVNPVDQLTDAYRKLSADKDTRQAVIVISNPMFDNASYTIQEKGLDIACNLIITLKIRDDALDITVFNRSNDIHWGLFGANLAQFSTIQELMASWLGVKVGTYCHITDSLHVYMDDYGSKITDDMLSKESTSDTPLYLFKTEPKMSMGIDNFDRFLSSFWSTVEPCLMNDEYMKSKPLELACTLNDLSKTEFKAKVDEYWVMVVNSMIAYRDYRLGRLMDSIQIIKRYIPSSQYKVSMLYFLKDIISNSIRNAKDADEEHYYQDCKNDYVETVDLLIHDLLNSREAGASLAAYLKLDQGETE